MARGSGSGLPLARVRGRPRRPGPGEHRWGLSAVAATVRRISADDTGDVGFRVARAFNLLTAAAALVTALVSAFVFGVMYLHERRLRAYGWFALGALTGSFYPAFVLDFTQPLFGAFDLPILGVSLALAASCATAFTNAHFRQRSTPRVLWLGAAGCVVVCALA